LPAASYPPRFDPLDRTPASYVRKKRSPLLWSGVGENLQLKKKSVGVPSTQI
jgi:hypothetical protein